jgi:predicted neuraminidase
MMIVITVPATSMATTVTKGFTDSTADVRLFTAITNRVAEIQNMDKTQLTSADRKALKKELKEMNKDANNLRSNQGIYLSVGAIIIIILLLILIL